MEPSSTDIDLAEQAIRAYLAAHPYSADTVEGVHEWWIARGASMAATEAALERLADAGVIERTVVANRDLWRLPTGSE